MTKINRFQNKIIMMIKFQKNRKIFPPIIYIFILMKDLEVY